MRISTPIIRKIEDNPSALSSFEKELKKGDEKQRTILATYPTVYIHNWNSKNEYEVYIGETHDVFGRTRQHYGDGKRDENSWQSRIPKKNAYLYIIGHEHFNRSMTLDIENRLILYLSSISKVKKLHNGRGNPQNGYYPVDEMDVIFEKIWTQLRKDNKDLFPKMTEIKDSAIFKASPFHKLTSEQIAAREKIIARIDSALSENLEHQLIFIEGEAGSGKTVLNSSTFYELIRRMEEKTEKVNCYMMVNHDEQVAVYEQIAQKLGLVDKYGEVVCKPTRFINHHTPEEPIDVAFVDEAHLLLTQGKQSYQGKNQLQDIINRAKVTVVMFDENQILTTEQYWEAKFLEEYRALAKKQENYIELNDQLRMKASPEIIEWIDKFTKEQELTKIPKQKANYSIKVFATPEELDKEIRAKAKKKDTSLSRLIASYDWDYSNSNDPTDRLSKYWEVMIGNWHKPWNRELTKKDKNKKSKKLAWAEQPQTINEVGSTFTIQGFDLNFAGVILGPSVKYRDGKIIFDPKESSNNKAVQNRTLSDGTKQKFGETLIQHEVRVLMTRGVNGLYIYACDKELREALLEAAK